jgi:hypothetical protein
MVVFLLLPPTSKFIADVRRFPVWEPRKPMAASPLEANSQAHQDQRKIDFGQWNIWKIGP